MPPKIEKKAKVIDEKSKNKKHSRDATNKARGFNYQRQYAIYYFLEHNIKSIIEEGKVNDLEFEDITYITKENNIITLQIKYHINKIGLCCSNDIFKTLKNINNLSAEQIYYIVSKNNKENTFDEKFLKWKNQAINTEELYELILSLKKDDKKENKSTNYQEFIVFLNELGKEAAYNYLKKTIIQEGYSYRELVEQINLRIQTKFNITNKKDIFYVRFKIYDLFENNWFEGNNDKPLIVDEEIIKIKKDLLSSEKETDKKQILSFIDILKKTVFDEKENNSNTHMIDEIKEFISIYDEAISINDTLEILKELSRVYKINKKEEIKNYYKTIRKIFCKKLLDKYKNSFTILKDNEKDAICSSIANYYRHSINKEIHIDRAKIAFLFDNDEKKQLKNKIIKNV
jgi:hypothetical protein